MKAASHLYYSELPGFLQNVQEVSSGQFWDGFAFAVNQRAADLRGPKQIRSEF